MNKPDSHVISPVVICGAGIAGIAAAYFLAVRSGISDVTLVDERRPLSLTSDKSTEAYRNWWVGPDDAMLRLMNRSIDLLEELADASDNVFLMNRRGYVYTTASPEHARRMLEQGRRAAAMGAGPLRVHDGSPEAAACPYVPSPASGWKGAPDGADLITDPALLREHFGYLAEQTVAVLHTRRCGWFSGQQLGMWMLDQARAHGVKLVTAGVSGVERQDGRVSAVRIVHNGEERTLPARTFVNCAGPMAREVGRMTGDDLPLFSERHLKIAFEDKLGVVPREAGLIAGEDPIMLPWTEEERAELAANPETRWLTETLPPGVHLRPEGHSQGSQSVLLLWAYHAASHAELFPVPLDPDYVEVALRGITTLIPGLRPYVERLPKAYVDGGYYTKTAENRPIVGPLSLPGAFTLCALSGFGLMAACAAADLLAAHITGAPLPAYAPAFSLARFADPEYRARTAEWGSRGQL